jgi:hypothetical protein
MATHERARRLAAERLDMVLGAGDAAWLDEHLVGCPGCRSVAAAYEADRVALRGLREHQPEPPRDLWARTAAALERESASRGGASRRVARGTPRSGPALGILSGLAVVAVVIGATVLSGGIGRSPTTGVGPGASTPAIAVVPTATPGPTPILVGAGAVDWFGTSSNGALAYNTTRVNEVCQADRQPDCPPVVGEDSKHVDIAIRPKSISRSPVQNQAVVVGTDSTGSDSVVVIALPTTQPSAAPSATPSTVASVTPVETPSQTAVAASATPVPPSLKPTPTATVGSSPTATPPIGPLVTPSASVASTMAIVSGVKVVGQSAAYSPDGAWFAFTARPSDGLTGPDIYVWRVGDQLARPLTTDHRSVFGSWAGNRLLGSRPDAIGDAGAEVAPRSFMIDPATGLETPMEASLWRPIVDPAGDRAVAWVGTVKASADGLATVPASGALVLRAFTPDAAPLASSVAGSTASPDAGTTASPDAGVTVSPDAPQVVADGPVAEFDVRWDETGSWLAVWVADATDPTIGQLSLVHLDRATGRLDRPRGAPQDVTALPGFSIADGRLAWATPPGQGGEGSRVQIVAWTNDTVGAVESGPVEDVVVVH